MQKRRGPSTDPWGTPDKDGTMAESSQQQPKVGLFRGLIAPKPYTPNKSHVQKAHPWDINWSLNDSDRRELCRLTYTALRRTPPYILGCFGEWGPGKPLRRNSGIFLPVYACTKLSCVASKVVEIGAG